MSNVPDCAEQAVPPESKDDTASSGAVKTGGLLVVVLIILSLIWYLAADRYTPYTDQARVQGYVIGVAPQVSGIVREVWVENNQTVEEGERLFRIDASQYEIALAKARSDLDNTLRQVQAGNAAVEAARANLLAAKANQEKAEKDTRRLERLRSEDPGTVSLRRLEISQASLDQARAGVSAAMSDIERAIQANGGDEEVNSLIQIAKTGVEKAELDIERTIVKASSRGVITDQRADVGLFAGAGNPVLTLVSLHDVWISAEYTENNLSLMQAGNKVELIFDVLPGKVFTGRVRNIGLGINAGSATRPGTLPTINNNRDWLRQSQRFATYVEFDPNQDPELKKSLRIGGQASVIVYNDDGGLLNWLGEIYIRFLSYMSYAY